MASSILTKLLIVMIAMVLLLQIVHMVLLYQLESVKAENYARLNEQSYLNLRQLNLDRQRMAKKLKNNHIVDSSGQYHIISNLLSNSVVYNEENSNANNPDSHPNPPASNPNDNPENADNPATSPNTNNPQGNQQESSSKPTDLTLITQCSASRLYYIEHLINAYHGPVSLSVFALSKDIPELVRVLMLLRKCLPLFRKHVKVHLVYPLSSDSLSIQMPSIDYHNLTCLTLSHQLAALRKHKEEHKLYGEGNGVQYPVNLLRNVARKNADSSYVLVLDIDLIPSRSLRKDFLQFVQQNRIRLRNDVTVSLNERIVFVLPTYEIDLNIGNDLGNIQLEQENNPDGLADNRPENDPDSRNWDPEGALRRRPGRHSAGHRSAGRHLGMNLGNIVGTNFGTNTVPTNKTALLELIRRKLVRPFYVEQCNKCQRSTNYEEWQLANADPESGEGQLGVLFEIFWQDPYEPFYIALNSDSLPYYDERFKQYGFNRISQVCELHIAGYRFLVLNNHFLVHKGFKRHDQFHDQKDQELERNRLLFRQFKNELKLRYPGSSRRCY